MNTSTTTHQQDETYCRQSIDDIPIGFTNCMLRCWQDERIKNAALQEKVTKLEEDLQMENECSANEIEYMKQQHEEALERKDQEIADIQAELDISRNIGNMSIKCVHDQLSKQKKEHETVVKEKDAEIEELKMKLLILQTTK
tara:strand:- start:138 stop:563 length:426 start_codon:yes stop_codon:yes gene_type:complete